MKNEEEKEWFRILASIRITYCANPDVLGTEATAIPKPFTIDDLIEKQIVDAGPNSTAREMASGYLSTLRKWGYVRRHERLEAKGPGRPSYSWVVTDSGFKTTMLPSPQNDLQKLLAAIRKFKEAEEEDDQQKALKKLLKVYDDIVDSRSPKASEESEG